MTADTKKITDNRHAEKLKEARATLRGMNGHVETIIRQNESMVRLVDNRAALLRDLSGKVGDLFIRVDDGRDYKTTSLKTLLQQIANDLAEGAAR